MDSLSASRLFRATAKYGRGGPFPTSLFCSKRFHSKSCLPLSPWTNIVADRTLSSLCNDNTSLRQTKYISINNCWHEPTQVTKRRLFSGCHRNHTTAACGLSEEMQRRNNIAKDLISRMHDRSFSKRNFRTGSKSLEKANEPVTAIPMTPLDANEFQSKLLSHVPTMAKSLLENGYYTTTTLLPISTIATLRYQSISLRFDHNRFEQSYSETIDETTGRVKERFDKEGVYACEPDGRDYYEATDLITYMSLLLQTLPVSLNAEWEKALPTLVNGDPPVLSNESFNAKLAVTEHGGAKYPLHVDNPQGLASGDTRKLTCILYLNPDYQAEDGGEIRLFLPGEDTTESWETLDLSPIGGRLLVFWSDEIPHEVLPTSCESISPNQKQEKDRYALTIWIPTSDVACLHNVSSKFHNLKDLVFEAKQNCDEN